MEGLLGGLDGSASALGSGHIPRVLGSSPTLVSLLSREPASLRLLTAPPACECAFSVSFFVKYVNKILKKKKRQRESVKRNLLAKNTLFYATSPS